MSKIQLADDTQFFVYFYGNKKKWNGYSRKLKRKSIF